jgi:heme-degrading monooxygenase HmoA
VAHTDRFQQGVEAEMPSTPQPLRIIIAFEVPFEADEAFIAGWERARERLALGDGVATPTLHRALRRDVTLRFVYAARVDSPETGRQAISDADFPGAATPFRAHPGLYEVVHEDGAPENAEGVILINPFAVSAEDDGRFLVGWGRARDTLATQRGYLGTRLHRSLDVADFRFVNVARWSSPLAFARAVQQPEFQHSAAAVRFPSHPALYSIIR